VDLPGGGDDEAVAAAEGGGPRGGEAGAQRRHVMCLPAYSTNGDGDACLYEQLCLGEPQRRLGASTIDLVWWGLRACPKQKRRSRIASRSLSARLRKSGAAGPQKSPPPAVRSSDVWGNIIFFVWYWLVATETNDRRYVVFYPAFPRCRGVDARVGEGCLPRAAHTTQTSDPKNGPAQHLDLRGGIGCVSHFRPPAGIGWATYEITVPGHGNMEHPAILITPAPGPG
jgi:hypothetical protein